MRITWKDMALGATLLASVLLGEREVRAGQEHVLVVAEDTRSTLVRTLVSELGAGGYGVDVVSAAAAIDMSTEAAARHARMVLRVSPSGDSIDLWTADREGSEVRFRERIAATRDGEEPRLLAIRAQEAVRGKLLPVEPLAPQEPPHAVPEKPVPLPSPATAAPAPPRFAASIGPSLVASPGGASMMGDAALGFSWLPSERWSIDAIARIPLATGHVDGDEGTAHVGLALAGGGASFAFADRQATLRPSAGAGVAFGWTHVDGVANAPFVSQSADLFAALPYVRLSMLVRWTPALFLRADVLGALSLPSQAITFAGRQVATFGEPVLDTTLAVGTEWR
jgi:hypothetical protein